MSLDTKVGYRLLESTHHSTAYVRVADHRAVGVDKYTDDPVTLKWSDTAAEWIQVAERIESD